MISIFMIFLLELVAFRWGSAKLASIGISESPHGCCDTGVCTDYTPELSKVKQERVTKSAEDSSWRDNGFPAQHVEAEGLVEYPKISPIDSAATQIIGVMILEFGILLHRCGILFLLLFLAVLTWSS